MRSLKKVIRHTSTVDIGSVAVKKHYPNFVNDEKWSKEVWHAIGGHVRPVARALEVRSW